MDKTNYYLNIAEAVAQKSTCLMKHWGAIIVKDNVIVSTGYNGAPRGITSCEAKGYCHLAEHRRLSNNPRGTMYEQCYSVHAEQNAIIFGSLERMKGATMYLVGVGRIDLEGNMTYVPNPDSCKLCKRMIINSGIEKVIVRTEKDKFREFSVSDWKDQNIVGGY